MTKKHYLEYRKKLTRSEATCKVCFSGWFWPSELEIKKANKANSKRPHLAIFFIACTTVLQIRQMWQALGFQVTKKIAFFKWNKNDQFANLKLEKSKNLNYLMNSYKLVDFCTVEQFFSRKKNFKNVDVEWKK